MPTKTQRIEKIKGVRKVFRKGFSQKNLPDPFNRSLKSWNVPLLSVSPF